MKEKKKKKYRQQKTINMFMAEQTILAIAKAK